MKIWKGNENTDDKIIATDNSVIYKGNPATQEINHCITDIQNGVIPKQGFTGIPVSYLQEIRMQEGKNYIELVMAKDSEEHLRINDEMMKQEVFNYFKNNIPGSSFTIDHYSWFRAGKKPLIALAVVAGLFAWTLPYAIGYDNGTEYEISNGRYNSLTGIVLAIASMGKTNVFLIFGGLAAIALCSFYFKARNPPVIHRLKLK